MSTWTAFGQLGDYQFTLASLKEQWQRLHQGDAEPLPDNADVLQAWVHFHNGEFEKAVELGLRSGGAGITAANKAACVYAVYLETREKAKLDLLLEVAQRAETLQALEPANPNAYYWQAYALSRYSEGVSVAKGLAQGLGARIKMSLERAIELAPQHADACRALGGFHAEVIDKVGSLIGSMTYGARKDIGLTLFAQAVKLNPFSPVGLVEYANGLMMLEGDARMDAVTRLYEQAASSQPLDAAEWLQVQMAKAELAA